MKPISWSPQRFAGPAILAIMLALLVALPSPRADAYVLYSCNLNVTTARIYVSANTAPTANLIASANEWEVGTSGIDLVETATEGNRHAYARNIDMGPNGYSGLTHNMGNLVDPPTCPNGHWDYDKITVSVNNHYNSGSLPRRNGVAKHEFGHFLGLLHENGSGVCPDGGSVKIAIMFFSDARFDGNCPVFSPKQDDKDGINAIY